MLATLLSFFGGSAFRMIWGEASAWLTKLQDHKFELERMKINAEMEAAKHERDLASIKLQHEMGVQIIRVQGEADIGRAETSAWESIVKTTGAPSGIWLVDLWNGVIRPALATICAALVVLHFWRANWTLDEQGWALVGAVLGIYIADRTLYKRGK